MSGDELDIGTMSGYELYLWPCAHCGLPCYGVDFYGVHEDSHILSCDPHVSGLPYGYRAHIAGVHPPHCLCSTDLPEVTFRSKAGTATKALDED